jgi:hypothetical protein
MFNYSGKIQYIRLKRQRTQQMATEETGEKRKIGEYTLRKMKKMALEGENDKNVFCYS